MQLQEEKSQASLIDSPDLYKSLVSITCDTGQYSLLGDIPCAPGISLPALLRQHTDHGKLCLHWKLFVHAPRSPILVLCAQWELHERGQTRTKLLPSTIEQVPGPPETVCLFAHVCTGITRTVPPPATWLLVSQQGLLVIGSVHHSTICPSKLCSHVFSSFAHR